MTPNGNRVGLALLSVLLTSCAYHQLPVSVERFIERRDACDHFRGEIPEPGDKTRMEEVRQMIEKFCTGTDAELAALRTRYYADGAITERLGGYETRIENRKP
jgi:hypothetical protein